MNGSERAIALARLARTGCDVGSDWLTALPDAVGI